MSFFKDILNIITNSNVDSNEIHFYQLEDLAVDFIKSNQQKGLRNLAYLELKLSKTKEGFNVVYSAYYPKGSSYIGQDKTGVFENITDIPDNFNKRLSDNGELTIKFKDVLELLAEGNIPVIDAVKFDSLDKYVKVAEDKLKNAKKTVLSKQLSIEDRIFKKCVHIMFTIKKGNGEELEHQQFLFVDILDLPEDIQKSLEANGTVTLSI